MSARRQLRHASQRIAANFNKPVASPFYALSKLLIAPRWIGRGVRAPGLRRWKRGELLEVAQAVVQRDTAAVREEWGDVGYYVAQSWRWLWWLYATITPEQIIVNAVRKFEARAAQKRRV